MNVLSLFDGISCGQQSLKELGIKVDKYYASEIDKYAIAITQHNFPNTIQLGDITKWKEWKIDFNNIDLLFAGFPCQSWSVAGKQKGDNDPRGALVHDLIDLWKHISKLNPNLKFLFENVRMKKEFLDYIDGLFGVEHIKINSALVSAQNRIRCYWTNIDVEGQPEDRGILLKDVLEDGSNKIGAMRGRYIVNGKRADTTVDSMKGLTKQRIEVRKDNKSNTITTVQKDNLCIQVGKADLKGHDYIKRVYSPEGKSPTLNANGGGNLEPKVSVDELQWRKLTPLECERLQTLPDNYTYYGIMNNKRIVMSKTRRYAGIGNGWTIEVIKHILKGLK